MKWGEVFRRGMVFGAALMFLTVSYASADASAGKALFEGAGKCGKCHKTTEKKKVGPGLKGVVARAGEDWIKGWLKDPPAVWKANDAYMQSLKKLMKKESKPKPTHKTKPLSDQQIADLLDYLKTL